MPGLLRAARSLLAQPTYSVERSDIDPLGFFVSNYSMQLAAANIPSGAVYTVVVGNDPPLSSESDLAIPRLFQVWLMPRRYTHELRAARWVVAYHESPGAVGIHYSKRIQLGTDATLLEVAP